MQKTAGKGVTRDLPPPLHACKINGPLCLRLCYSAPRGKKESRSARFRLAFFSFYIFFLSARARCNCRLRCSPSWKINTRSRISFFFFFHRHTPACISLADISYIRAASACWSMQITRSHGKIRPPRLCEGVLKFFAFLRE